jgi:nitrite reductase (NADH) small subunit
VRCDGEAVVVGALTTLPVERGVAALVDGVPVAVFRLSDGEILAIDHVDPFSGVPVLARGIVASVGERIAVASPLHKQRFDLRTGECLDDPTVQVRTWPVRIVGEVVVVDRRGRQSDPRTKQPRNLQPRH